MIDISLEEIQRVITQWQTVRKSEYKSTVPTSFEPSVIVHCMDGDVTERKNISIIFGLGGKIGVILGAVLGIVTGILDKSVVHIILYVVSFTFVFGITGLIIERIVRFIILLVKGIMQLIERIETK